MPPSQPGVPVRFLDAIAAPEESCFWPYQPPSADAVRAAMSCARLRPARITHAVTVTPSQARPDAAATAMAVLMMT